MIHNDGKCLKTGLNVLLLEYGMLVRVDLFGFNDTIIINEYDERFPQESHQVDFEMGITYRVGKNTMCHVNDCKIRSQELLDMLTEYDPQYAQNIAVDIRANIDEEDSLGIEVDNMSQALKERMAGKHDWGLT